MATIAFLTLSQGEPYNRVERQVRTVLDTEIGSNAYRFIRYSGPYNPDAFAIHIRDFIRNIGADVFITCSDETTRIAIQEVKPYRRPLIFCMVFDPIKAGFIDSYQKRKAPITGVVMAPRKSILPAQLLLKVQPNIRKLLLIYRPCAQLGITANQMMYAKKHFEQAGITTLLHEIVDWEVDLNTLKKDISYAEGVVTIEASVVFHEYKLINELCQKNNTPVWIGTQEDVSIPTLSITNSFEAIGKIVAKQTVQVVANNVHPGNIPVVELSSARKLKINKVLCLKTKLAMTKKLTLKLSETFEKQENLKTYTCIIVQPQKDPLIQCPLSSFTYQMRCATNAHFHYQTHPGWLRAKSYEARMHLLHIASMSYAKAVIVTGDKYAYTICKHFKDNDINRPIIYFTNTNEDQSPYNWHNKYSTPEMPIVRISIPPPNLRDQAKLLLAAAPHLRQVCLLVRYDSFSQIPLRLQSDIAQWQSFCMKRNVMPTIRYSPHEKYLEQIPTGVFTKDSGWIVCAENIPYSVMRQMGEWFIQHNVPAVSGSLTWARWFPLTIGIDADAIAEHKMMPVLKRILLEKQSPERDGSPVELRMTNDISLEYEQWYRACINEEVATQLGLDVKAAKAAVKYYKIVPVDYALDTAICMNQFTVEERLAMLEQDSFTTQATHETSASL